MKVLVLLFAWCLQLSYSIPELNLDGYPVVTTPLGEISGLNQTSGETDVSIFAFRGIPFAQPPLDDLRFAPPEPIVDEFGFLNATENPPTCLQITGTGRENCLYLNVYVPQAIMEGSPMPVMVWIHGGGYSSGAIADYDEPFPLTSRDVIVVCVQYRLGVIGFFSTDDEAAPGNQGIQDQTMGLKWVNDNIEYFGGDITRITLFGESAGSSSTHMQILSPYSAGLFQRAVLQSGNALDPWAVGREYYDVSRDIAERFNCSSPTDSSEEIVDCLRGVNAKLLSTEYRNFLDWNFQPFYFGPRVDGNYLPDEPIRLIKDGNFNRVAIIMGCMKDEMSFVTGEMFLFPRFIESLEADFDNNGPASLHLRDDEEPVETAYKVYDYYLGGINVEEDNIDNLTLMYTDNIFHMPMDWHVQYGSPYGDIYAYQVNYKNSYAVMDAYKELGLNITDAWEYISHGDDIPYIFETSTRALWTDPNDFIVADLFSDFLTNFAKYGNPTPDDTLIGYQWPPADWSNYQVLSITPTPTLQSDIRYTDRQFWETLPLRINRL